MTTRDLPYVLRMEDRNSMFNNIEARVPFLDNDLVDFAMKCPVNLKLNNLGEVVRINENDAGRKSSKYFQKTNDGKKILRRMMKKYIPKEITEAQKQGFSSPDASWFKGESIEFVKRTIFDTKANIYDFLDYNSIEDLITDHLDGKENRRLLIWSLLNLEEILK